jgi:hypothetical protein
VWEHFSLFFTLNLEREDVVQQTAILHIIIAHASTIKKCAQKNMEEREKTVAIEFAFPFWAT